jgi:hypothetical protein
VKATIGVSVAIVLLTMSGPVAGGESETDDGELTIYSGWSEIGMVAERVFRDGDGRIAKTIYYGLRPGVDEKADRPYTEEMLAVREIVRHVYDDQGREIREERYSPDMRLRQVAQTTYNARGRRTEVVYLNAEGVRTYVTRWSTGTRKTTDLYFDESGEGLIGIRGALPDDMDLVSGWGRAMHGLSCGLAATTTSGTLRDIRVYATVRNRGPVADEITAGHRMRLVGTAGRALPPDDRRRGAGDQDSTGSTDEDAEALQQIEPGAAVVVVHGELARWYSDVPPGHYSLTVVCRDSDGDFSIVSNKLAVTIRPLEE